MALKIRRAAVLGSGVMGAQIAALLAAAGVRTHLLDLASEAPPADPKAAKAVGSNFRSTRAILAVENLKALKPSPLYSESVLVNIIPGNFDDDMSVLNDVDWVIEAVAERMDIKKSILKRIAQNTRPSTPITTNTSGLSMAAICADEDEFVKRRFFGTHFFNPPRYMKLLEIIPHGETDPELVKDLSQWIRTRLGKGLVTTNDTINFIANRIGVFNIQATLRHMADLKLNIETVDALTGKLMGRPASATFRTMDVVGLDVFHHVARNVYDYDPKDPYREWFLAPAWLEGLIKSGRLGQKSNSVGMYKKDKSPAGETVILAYRPEKDTYEPQASQTYAWVKEASKMPDTLARMKFILSQKDEGAEFIWRVLRDTMAYSALLLGDIANDNGLAVDQAIAWGFNWEWGPFQLWQGLGYDGILERMQKDGTKLPAWAKAGLKFYEPTPGSQAWFVSGPTSILTPSINRREKVPTEACDYHLPRFRNPEDKRVVLGNDHASLLDIGHGIACLTFHGKMNVISREVMDILGRSIDETGRRFDGLVIANDGEAFCAGANLYEVLTMIDQKNFDAVDQMVRTFQGTLQLLKFAPFPTVACPQGLTLGGGVELSLHAHRQLLAGDTFAGLVEVGVGLLPAGGGTKELALRAYDLMQLAERGDPMPFLQKAFMLIGMAKTSTSGLEAIEMGLFPQWATMTISRDHQVDRAKGMVLELLNRGYAPPTPRTAIPVVGDPGVQTFKMAIYNMKEGRQISEHDALIAEKIAIVLCGGEIDGGQTVSEGYLLDLERNGFVELCQTQKTRDRIETMLKTGKPLRN